MLWKRIAKKAVRSGMPPSWFGYRWVKRETVPQYLARKQHAIPGISITTIHDEEEAQNPLPCNIERRSDLPVKWARWGYSFRDVPSKNSGKTFMATLPQCKVIPCLNRDDNQFWVAILNQDKYSLELDQISFRPWHAEILRKAGPPERIKRATWVIQRVYHNHSHWVTAHLPKFLLLKERGELYNVLMPAKKNRTPAMDSSLEMLGIDPDGFQTFENDRPLMVDQLTVLETDRFRPGLLRMVRDAMDNAPSGNPRPGTPHRRVYISREKAQRRKLINEQEVWAVLETEGFEKVCMEDLGFPEQVAIMQQAAIVVAPHGAAIANTLFCAPGTHVVEIAYPGFPNPNFYALASAMGHNYWILDAQGIGKEDPPLIDLHIDPAVVRKTVQQIIRNQQINRNQQIIRK